MILKKRPRTSRKVSVKMQVFTLKGVNLKFDLRTSSEEILGIYLRELLLKTLWMNKITERGYV